MSNVELGFDTWLTRTKRLQPIQGVPHYRVGHTTGARNTLPGTIRKIEMGAVNAQLTIEVAPGINIVSIITVDAVENLSLAEGKRAYAVIKASSVMVGIDS
jgi:molybdopterin-binding protein